MRIGISSSLTPADLAKSGSEYSQQVALFSWAAKAREFYPELEFMFAIPNGGWRDKITAGKMRASGVKRGVPDICLPVRRFEWCGLFIEMKRPKQEDGRRAGFVTKEQTIWMEFLQKQGFGVMVCRTWEEAKDGILKYLEWKM